jgi:lysophospholipase L1-like esterase
MRRTLHRLIVFAAALLLPASVAAQNGGFYLKDGDRVVFYGDSITEQKLYTNFAETFVLTRFPHLNVSFVNSGWGGDRVTGGGGGPIERRLQRDVFPFKPTVVTVMLGMNDGGYRPLDDKIYETYTRGYQKIVSDLKRALPGVRLTLIQPSPYDDVTRPPTFEGGYNATMLRFAAFVKELAAKEGALTADLNTPVVAALEKANAADAKQAQRIINDRVHPGAGGHVLMAAALLKAWGAPAVVTEVEIDAARAGGVRAVNTKVTGLTVAESLPPILSWTQEDRALPFPLDMNDPVFALAVRSSDFVETLNRQPLRVKGLPAARYALKIDGAEVGVFTKEELEKGVNLAVLPTPMLKQAQEVHALTNKHNNLRNASWRQVQVPMENVPTKNAAQAVAAINALEAEVVAAQRAAARPKPRRYELTPQG